jgi:hypothetical protein
MAAKPIFVQAVDTNGTPYSGAKLNVYDAGTTTPRAIYTESGLGTASANPAIADANGVVVVWVNDAGGDIKVTLTNSAETVTPHNEDNVPIASLTCYPVITFQGDQSLLTTSSPNFAGLTLGNVSFAGVVTDPNADRLVFWDDSAGQVNFMTLGTGLAFNGTALELDGDLQDISGLTPTDGGVIIGDGTDFVVESGATLRTSIGLGTGDSVTFAGLTLASGATVTAILDEDGLVSDSATAVPTQQSVKAYADSLADTIADINAITQADGTIIVSDGSNWVGESGATARASLGVSIGSDVQAYAPGLASIAGLTTAADKMIYTTASNTYATADLTPFARTILDDANAKTARTTLGVGHTGVESYTALKALTAGDYDTVSVSDTDRGGLFAWASGDQSANITADPGQGVWVPPSSDTSGSSGAWERLYAGPVSVRWFGAVGDGDPNNATTGTDDQQAFQRACNYASSVYVPGVDQTGTGYSYRLDSQLAVPLGCHLWTDANYTGIRWTSGGSGWQAPNGATLLINNGSGGTSSADAAITLDDRSEISGFCIMYPGQDMAPSGLDTAASPGAANAPTEFPPTIAGPTGANTAFICTARRLYMPNSYIGFSFDGEGSDHYIEDVRGYFIYKLAILDGHQNPPRLRKILDSNGFAYTETVRPSNSLDRWSQEQGVGVEIGSIDWMTLYEVFIFRKNVAFDFVSGTGADTVAASNTVFTFCQHDECHIGFRTTSQPRGTRIIGHTGACGDKYDTSYIGDHFMWTPSSDGDVVTEGCEFRGSRVGTFTGGSEYRLSFKSNTGSTFSATDDCLLFDGCTNVTVDATMDGAANTYGIRATNGCTRLRINATFHNFSSYDVVLEDGTGTTDQYEISVLSDQTAANSVNENVSSPDGTILVNGTGGTSVTINGAGVNPTSDDIDAAGDWEFQAFLSLDSAQPTLTLDADGEATVTGNMHRIAPNSGTTDDLERLNGGSTGDLMVIGCNSSANTITVKHIDPGGGTGRIYNIGELDIPLVGNEEKLLYINVSGNWFQLGGVSNLASSDGTTGGTGSAGAGNQYVELRIAGTTYKVLHDGTV